MKKILFILTMLAAFLVNGVAMAASSLVDNADLLSQRQEREVLQVLEQVEKAHNVRVAVVTMPSIGNNSMAAYANKLVDDVYNDGAKGNMVLLQVTDQRKWYISTDSKLKDITGTNDAVNYMSKAFVSYLSNGDYANAYKVYATKANDLLDYYAKNGKPVKKEKPFPNEPALVFALFGAFIFTKSVRKSLLNSMSNVNAAVAADAYLDERSFELKDSSDTYMYSNVVAVPRPRGNGHHGGGSGGHG
ncbi:MAG: TPM domain-containing protein, partial [Phascolarctobacterium sp.]|nr:TPM domain-containing protein [Phascolarctobacterium sp.]